MGQDRLLFLSRTCYFAPRLGRGYPRAAMGRYYLHITDQDQFIRDVEGFDAAGPEEARREAERTVRELLQEGLWSADSRAGRLITVVDGTGSLVDTVSLWQVLETDGAFPPPSGKKARPI